MGEKEMRHENGHRPTKMGVGRHHRVTRRFRLSRKRGDDSRHLVLKSRDPSAEIQSKVERNLLVARASCVKPLAEVADSIDELPLHECVNVFVRPVNERRIAPPLLEDVVEGRRDHLGLMRD